MAERQERDLTPRKYFDFSNFFSPLSYPMVWEEVQDRLGQLFHQGSAVDISEDDKNVYVSANLPGLKASDIDVSLDRHTLLIKAEKKQEESDKTRKYYRRSQNSFFYQVTLPSQVDESSEQAEYEDGVLHITFKKADKALVKKINVKGGKQEKKK